MTDVHIRFDWGQEPLAAAPVGPAMYELHSNSAFIPLARGDIVVIDPKTAAITDVREMAAVYVVEAFFKLNASDATVSQRIKEWKRATYVQQTTRLTVLINAESIDWVKDVVEADPQISMVERVREPSQPFSLADAIARENHGAETEGAGNSYAPLAIEGPVDIDEKASSLARILTTWQLAAANGLPAVVLAHQLEIVHRVSGELITILPELEPGTRIHIDPRLADATAESLAELFSEEDSETPDSLPDWLL